MLGEIFYRKRGLAGPGDQRVWEILEMLKKTIGLEQPSFAEPALTLGGTDTSKGSFHHKLVCYVTWKVKRSGVTKRCPA